MKEVLEAFIHDDDVAVIAEFIETVGKVHQYDVRHHLDILQQIASRRASSVIKRLRFLKSSLMNTRRFGPETLRAFQQACTNAECDLLADIEPRIDGDKHGG